VAPSRRALNRALLARQGLLERRRWDVGELVRRLVGLQAQEVDPPYFGAWSRLEGFTHEELATAVREGAVVRAPAWRSTLHLLDAGDHRALFGTAQLALERGMRSFFGKDLRDHDVDAIAAAARELLLAGPAPMGELRAALAGRFPAGPRPEALAYVLRTRLPVAQQGGGVWRRGGSPPYALVDGAATEPDLDGLLRRYLAAFGPATVRDAQAWSGLTGLREAWAALGRAEDVVDLGDGLLDLAGAPRPAEDVPAPVRLVARYDNLVLGHADRTRVVPDEHRAKVFLSAGRVRETLLVDGVVAGTWSFDRGSGRVALEPFGRLPAAVRREAEAEARALEAFLAAPPA
jgi:hypothetical protein